MRTALMSLELDRLHNKICKGEEKIKHTTGHSFENTNLTNGEYISQKLVQPKFINHK
jgi:hypothetical protein